MRKIEQVTITAEGRDKGKTFTIREMPAFHAEEWFTRAVMLLARSGLEVPTDIMDRGAMAFVATAAGLAIAGLSKANYDDVQPLLAQMMNCVTYNPPGAPMADVSDPAQLFAIIEDVKTILFLREKVISLHVGFSVGDYVSLFLAEAAVKLTPSSPNTPTSLDPSPSPSQVN